MQKRPISITTIAWIYIASGFSSIISMIITFTDPERRQFVEAVMTNSPIPLTAQYAIIFTGAIIGVVCAVAILKGMNWGRWLYVGWNILSILIALVTAQINLLLIPGFLFFIVVTIFLFRSKASAFFLQKISIA